MRFADGGEVRTPISVEVFALVQFNGQMHILCISWVRKFLSTDMRRSMGSC